MGRVTVPSARPPCHSIYHWQHSQLQGESLKWLGLCYLVRSMHFVATSSNGNLTRSRTFARLMSWQQPLLAGFNGDVCSTPADKFEVTVCFETETLPCQYWNNWIIFTFHLSSDVKSEMLHSFLLGHIISIATFSSNSNCLITWFSNNIHFSCHKGINVILWSQSSAYIWHI